MWFLPVLSGIFIGTSYIPFPPWASLFCFVPLWLFCLRQTRLRDVLLGCWLTSIVFTLIGFNWVAYLLHEFAGLGWVLSIVGVLLFACIAHLYVPVAGGLWFLLQQGLRFSPAMSVFLLALLTVLCEAYSLTLFDWNFGYSWFGAGLPIYQLAEFIGFSGLSALTLLLNLPLYFVWIGRNQLIGKKLLVAVVAGFVALNGLGLWLKNRLPPPDASFTTLLVQADIGNEQKLAAELGRGFRKEIIERYLQLTEQALQQHSAEKIDFIVWPEAAFPAFLNNSASPVYAWMLQNFLQKWRIPLITGAFSADWQTRRIGNSLFVVSEQGQVQTPFYTKSILLAFGEYIPGESFFPQIRQWLPPIGQFKRGPGPSVLLSLHDYKIGPQICYESLFPAFSRGLANLGAQFIVNVTNDSWYGAWQEPYQHMYMTLARAVELRRPIIRVTNTGISTVGLASGQILQKSPMYKPWTALYKVGYIKKPQATFYQRWFYLGPALLWMALILLLGFGWMRKKHAEIGKKA